jgi:hypothetical protein
MHNQSFLNNYFANNWQSSIEHYVYSGLNIIEKIPAEARVLDVGCGTNPFKGLIKNLVGIDPARQEADIITTIEDYKPTELFDIAFCFGSINFGNDITILKQISSVVNCLKEKSTIYWRCNPGLYDHKDELCEKINFYPWTFERLSFYANFFGYTMHNSARDTDGKNIRLYCEWIKN